MIVKAYYRPEALNTVLEQLQVLPEPLRPTRFSSTDAEAPAGNKLSARDKYEKFFKANASGHFLFSDRCIFGFTRTFRSGFSTLLVDPLADELTDEEASTIFGVLGHLGADFWFAADDAEYHHRNRYFVQLGNNNIEAWVGRDLGKYLPGLYWMTGVNMDLAQRFGLSTHDAPPGAVVRTDSVSSITVRMPGSSSAWQSWATDVDAFCMNHSNIFSLERIRSDLSVANNYLELSAILRKWH